MILTLKKPTLRAIDMSPITTELITTDWDTILRTPLKVGTEDVPLGKLFALTAENEESLIIRSSHPCLKYVGAGMSAGELIVEGDAGDYCAYAMRGGSVRVQGSVGIHAACDMTGGSLFVRDNAGDALGGARTGVTKGFNGGEIIVGGNTGARVGERMRRGTLIVLGDCGDYCAAQMIAGTIVVLGKPGRNTGYEMRRGTVILSGTSDFDDTFFARSGAHTSFMPLLARYLRNLDQRLQDIPDHCRKRYIGDISVGGLGEVLVL